MPSARCPWVWAAFFYFALITILTWPLALRATSAVPHDIGDPLENIWILWWNGQAAPLTERWWNGPILWPAPGALALSEHLVGISVWTTPLQWLGASATTAYNVVFLLSFPLCALAAHGLVFALTGRHDAGLVAGLLFGFNRYRVVESAHLQTLAVFWMPIALLALHRYVAKGTRWWLAVFAVAWLLQALSNGYLLFFFPVLIVLWMMWFVRDLRTLAAIVAAWVASSLPLVPFMWKYREVHTLFNLRREFTEIESFSPDATSFFNGDLSVGFVGLVLVIVAVMIRLWSSRHVRVAAPTIAFVAAAAVFAGIAISVRVIGPWQIRAAGATVASARVFHKPLTTAILLLTAGLALDPRFRGPFERRSTLAFYGLAAAAMAVFSLGPNPKFLGTTFLYQAPYRWLLTLPGFDALRVPARFEMLTVLCLSAAAGLAFARASGMASDRARFGAAALVVGGILVESSFTIPMMSIPERFRLIETAADGAVLEIPPGDTEHDTPAMYRSMFHRRPLLNGAAGFSPPHYEVLRAAIDDEDEGALDEMASVPLVVTVDTTRELGKRWEALLLRRAGSKPLGSESGRPVFWIPAADRLADGPVGDRLPIQAVSANVHAAAVRDMLDSNLDTLWQTDRPQRGGETVTIDLGAVRTVDAIGFSLGRFAADYPRRLSIEASENDEIWTSCWDGRPGRRALAAAKQNPRIVPLTIPLAPVRARRIRLRQSGSNETRRWSIPELAVYGR
jgi:hypothetical protein